MIARGQRSVLFDHLPKTGGTAFRSVLEELFGRKNVTPHFEGRSEGWAIERYSGFRVISGHFMSHLPGDMRAGGRARITILRHPVDRAISEYFYRRHHSFEGVDDKLARWAQQYDICTFFRMRDESDETAVRNYYTKHFSSRISRRMASDESLLSDAKAALEKYDFVGISEQMQESVDVFCWQYGMPPVEEVPVVNVTSSRTDRERIDPAARAMLSELNSLDLDLYEYARASLDRKKSQLIHELVGTGTHLDGRPPGQRYLRRFGKLLPRSVFGARNAANGSGQRVESTTVAEGKSGEQKTSGAQRLATASAATRPISETFGNGLITIQSAEITGIKSGTNTVAPGESVELKLRLLSGTNEPALTVGMEIRDSLGEVVFGTNTYLQKKPISVTTGHEYEVTFRFSANLNRGRYDVGAALHTRADHSECCYHWCDNVAQFDVVQLGEPDFVGYCKLEPSILWKELAPGDSTMKRSAPSVPQGVLIPSK